MLDFSSMQSSLSSSLLIIDDRRLRGEAFAPRRKIHRQNDRLEAAMQSFRDHDQKLFNNWYELTFRSETMKTEKFREEFRTLVRFITGLSRPRAFKGFRCLKRIG